MVRPRATGPAWARPSLALWDFCCWQFAMLVLLATRYDFVLEPDQWRALFTYSALLGIAQVLLGYATRVYRGRFRIGSFEEAAGLTMLVFSLAAVIGVAFAVLLPNLPRASGFIAPALALLTMLVGRFVAREWLMRRSDRLHAVDAEPVLVYGAGNAGQQLNRLLTYDPKAPYLTRGFIDDDVNKRHLRLHRARVLGDRTSLVRLAAEVDVHTIILAIPSAGPEFVRELAEELDRAGLRLLVMPSVQEIMRSGVKVEQLHEVNVLDVLGRRQISTNLTEIADYLTGKVILITGAGGSIGSEIARQVHKLGPKELVLLDRDESGLHGVQLSLYGQALLDTPDIVLCDIRDADALERVFADHAPDVVFHAAALKHLPMLEQYPEEGWKTNVLGTHNVLTCARRHGVQRFVNISTDKAADPTSVLGKTKRRAEKLTSWFAAQGEGSYLSVRFGNVLGSRGSVLHTFAGQIAQGGPITVVHPDITRYFMTIPEACQLVIQAGAIGRPGDVLVLDMGEPVRILDVAKQLIKQSGKEIEIVFTGLRPGEKMHEVLFSVHESADRLSHPLISRVPVPPAGPETLVLSLEEAGILPAPAKSPSHTSTDSTQLPLRLVGA